MLPFANPPSAEAGHEGSTAGGTNCLSMGSASVPMGTQDKHDLLLRITPASSPTGEEEEGKLPDASQGARSEPRRKFRTEAGGSSLSQTDPLRTSDNVYWILRRHLSAIYAAGACPAKQLPHRGLGLACRPPLPAAGRRRNRRLLARNLELARRRGLFGDDSTARAFNASSPPPLHGSSICIDYIHHVLDDTGLSLFSNPHCPTRYTRGLVLQGSP